ncbi:unnamed protein product [Rhizoctonia solani]|uniref:BTB domain-containing protein n=1 Tax=Rhizoctonia solani TaxID=456999 RepID=A0A8H2WGU3_9AGAM|nr:unnamed protein product [Rhizoctonia solani]
MPNELIGMASLPTFIYVSPFAACPDSEPEDRDELELDVDESPTIGNESSVTQMQGKPHETGTTNPSSTSSGNRKTSTSVYPDLLVKAPSSSNVQQGYTGYRDGNIRLLIGTKVFLLHEHKLQEFSILKEKIKDARQGKPEPSTSHNPHSILELYLDEDPEDFAKMMKILYTPIYGRISSSDHLKSTLRLATKFDHPVLRSYAIERLEESNLPPIERIKLAQNSNVSSWRKEALNELCVQDDPITLAEANILGMKTFVDLVHRREAYKLSRGPKPNPFNETMGSPQDPPRAEGPENRANLRPRDRPQKNLSERQEQTSSTSRRTTRSNAGKCRVEPYRNHHAASR